MYRFLLSNLIVLFSAVTAAAQGDPGANARFHFGPLAVTPSASLSTGVDTNVRNEEENEQRDVVTRLTPQVDGWLKAGRVQLTMGVTATALHFAQLRDQRSFNTGASGRADIDLFRFVPYVSATVVRSRERSGFEIDQRALRVERNVAGGVAANISPRTKASFGGYLVSTGFADEQFAGANLRQSLNRERGGYTAAVRYAVTPLTTFSVAADLERERFDFSPERDAESVRIMPAVDFSPAALLNGRASVGYRNFDPVNPAIPDFSGLVAGVDVSYVLRGATRFSVRADRDVTYSFEATQPYYLLTAWQASVSRSLTDRLSVAGIAGRQRLDYRALAPAAAVPGTNDGSRIDRVDTGTTLGANVFYASSRDTQFGFTVDYSRRASGVVTRGYDGVRATLVAQYGR